MGVSTLPRIFGGDGVSDDLNSSATSGMSESDTYATLNLNFVSQLYSVNGQRKRWEELFTWSRLSSGGTYFGSDGLMKTAATNLLLQSETFDNASWTKNDSTISVNATASPAGTLTADLAIPSVVSAAHRAFQSVTVAASTVTTLSFYFKEGGYSKVAIREASATGAYVSFDLSSATILHNLLATGIIVGVGNGWYRCSATFTTGASFAASFYVLSPAYTTGTPVTAWSGDGVSGIYVWGAQLETGSIATTYLPTTTTVNSAPRFDYDPVTFAPKGLLVEEARTNNLLHSRDFTNAAWVKTGITAVKNAVGVDGVSNSASTLTATAPNGTALQTLTLAAAARSFSVFIKRKTGTGVVEITRDNISFTDITSQINSTTYARVKIENTSVLNPVCGVRIATSGDELEVDYSQDEAGTFITSSVATTTTAVTRAADVCQMTGVNFSSWYSQTEGTFVVKSTCTILTPSKATLSVSDGTVNNEAFQFINTTHASQVVTGGVGQATLLSAASCAVGDNSNAFAIAANNFAASLNGATAVADVAGTVPTVNVLNIGRRANATLYLNGYERSILYFSKRLSNAQLVALSS